MTEVAKIPDWHDMDWGQFIQHWLKRHAYHEYFLDLHLKYPDDDANIWWSVKGHHDRIHAGTFDEQERFQPPKDHIHLPPVDPELHRILEELL
jgi:hypothetical protein